MSVEVRIDPGVVARTLLLRNGTVARRLAQRTERTADIAEREVPGCMGRYITWKVEEGPRPRPPGRHRLRPPRDPLRAGRDTAAHHPPA